MVSADPDRVLLSRCFARSPGAWEAFVDRFGRLIYSVVYGTLRRHDADPRNDLAEELFASTFIALSERDCRKLRQWSGRCSLASWIRLVTASVVIDALRRARPALPLDDLLGDGPTPPELVDDTRRADALLAEIDRALLVRRALGELDPHDRELLLMLFREDLSPGEVAARLGVKPGALYTRKNRALSRLRAAVERLGEWP